MDREALKSKLLAELGSTKLTGVTEETLNHQLDFALSFVSDDTQVDENFVKKVAENLKKIDGNVHFKVGKETESIREQLKDAKEKAEHNSGGQESGDEEPEWFKTYRTQQEDRIKKMEESQALKEAEAAKHAAKEQVKSGLRKKFETAGLTINDELLDITMSGIKIPEKELNIESLVSDAERSYTERAKRLNLDLGYSHGGQGGGGGNKDPFYDNFISNKTADWKKG